MLIKLSFDLLMQQLSFVFGTFMYLSAVILNKQELASKMQYVVRKTGNPKSPRNHLTLFFFSIKHMMQCLILQIYETGPDKIQWHPTM